MMRLIVIATLLLSASPAVADGEQFAKSLAWVVATDRMCGVTYKSDALEAMIVANVPAEDLTFAQDLNLYVSIANGEIREMTDATKAAICVQIARVAKSHGLID